MRMIKASIYLVDGRPARFTGRIELDLHFFKVHNETDIAVTLDRVSKASADDIKAYFGKK